MIIGGIYRNENKHLPDQLGRTWYEADINYYEGRRNRHRHRHRILWLNDGLIFVAYDHFINWDNKQGFSKPGSPINYPDEVPEFKSFNEIKDMNNDKKITYKVIQVDPENYRFKTISDFKWCMKQVGEVEFEWNGKDYSITHPEGMINICKSGTEENEKDYETADKALEYVIDGQRLREIITKVKVWSRTI